MNIMRISTLINVTLVTFGLVVLLPALLLTLHMMALENLASSGESGQSLTTWLTIATLIGGLVHLFGLGTIVVKGYRKCKWCRFFCAGYATYVAIFIAYIMAGNFMRKVELSGVLYALSSHVQDVIFVVIPLVFAGLILFSASWLTGKNEREKN